MTLKKRLCVGGASLLAALTAAAAAYAAPPKPLSTQDARAYASAFAAVDQGDFVGAELMAAEIKDKSLVGYISFRQLMHPKAHKASFDELCGWLVRFKDLPLAEKVFSLAWKRKPADAVMEPPTPEVAGLHDPRSEITKPAREAFYSGDARTAYALAVQVGERWIAGLSAWRLGDYAKARDYFSQLAGDEAEDPWVRAAGAYWAARTAATLNDHAGANGFLKLAAGSPQTFYGMLAEKRIQAQVDQDGIGELILANAAAPSGPAPELTKFVSNNPRAHRATALAQIGRYDEARQELRAGLAMARGGDERRAWTALVSEMGEVAQPSAAGRRYQVLGDYQTPALEPTWGFTIDRALVYAIVRQESAFDPGAVSPVGAIGLMQVMPGTAALASGDEKYKRNAKPLFDASTNLRVGQDYIAWLMDRGVGPDLLKIVAAYNAGPGAVLNTIAKVGDEDPLLLIECLPALETRNYVEKVVQAYWTYKRIFGDEPQTLAALAGGAKRVDVRMDLPNTPSTQPDLAAQPVEISSIQGAVALD